MIIKKELKRYCRSCLKHSFQKIKINKKKKPSELKQGQRKFRRTLKGYRGFPRPKPSAKRTIKKHSLLAICNICFSKSIFSTNRLKKIEIK